MVYKRVVINGEVYRGEDVDRVTAPENGYWTIVLKSGLIIHATGQVTVVVKE
jgi:hypothetical protein